MCSIVHLCAAQQDTVTVSLTNLLTEQFFFVILLCKLHWAQTTQVEVGRNGTSNFHAS